MFDRINKIAQRHLIPSFVASIYFYYRDRSLINLRACVQLTRKISFGRGSEVKAFAVIQSSGGAIRIGENCAIGNFNHISTNAADIVIGDNVRFGPHVCIMAMSHITRDKDQLIANQGYTSKGITIGNDVFVGAGTIILDGCTIGDGVVIGVGSIVNKSVPPYTIVFGSPAKRIFERY